MPAVSSRRASLGHKLLPPEGHAAVATIAGLDPNSRFVNKHFSISSVQGCALDCSNSQIPERAWTPGTLDGYDAVIFGDTETSRSIGSVTAN
jgi:hypothetical protein